MQLEAERLAQAAEAVQKAMRTERGGRRSVSGAPVGARGSGSALGDAGDRMTTVGPEDPASSLSRAYRYCLKAYPAWYRLAFGDDLVAVLRSLMSENGDPRCESALTRRRRAGAPSCRRPVR